MSDPVRLNSLMWAVDPFSGTKLADTSDIPEVTGNAAWGALTTPAWCWYNNTADAAFQAKYGRIYNWFCIGAGLQMPAGYRVPTNAECGALITWLIANGYNWDGSTTGNKIGKAVASAGGEWAADTTPGNVGNNQTSNNQSGLARLPGGARNAITGAFSAVGITGYYWAGDAFSAGNGYRAYLSNSTADFVTANALKNSGHSIRLCRNLLTPVISGITAVGNLVTIAGTNFKPDSANPVVTENGAAITPLSISNTVITYATALTGTLTYAVTNSDVETDSDTVYVNTPVSITAADSPVTIGATSTITGTGFLAAQGSGSVSIGGQAQSIVSWSDTEIEYTVHALTPTGAQTVTVTNSDGETDTASVTVAVASGVKRKGSSLHTGVSVSL